MKAAKEPTFNIFLFITGSDRVIREIGLMCHNLAGSDQSKLRLLRESVEADLPRARRFLVPAMFVRRDDDGTIHQREFSFATFQSLQQTMPRTAMHMFEEAFQTIGAPPDPLMCITCVVDGKVMIEAVVDL